MTIKEKIEIPLWLLTIILSALIGFFSYSITFVISYTETKKDVAINTQAIIELRNGEVKDLRNSKADTDDVNAMKISLFRIENKLDNFILLKK